MAALLEWLRLKFRSLELRWMIRVALKIHGISPAKIHQGLVQNGFSCRHDLVPGGYRRTYELIGSETGRVYARVVVSVHRGEVEVSR